jgi:cation diffusion facilitator CzcD-associated flavoprotein CzcO
MNATDTFGTEGTQSDVLECDLCILGAGIAGLNALFAASRRLTRDQKIVLVDQRDAPAGMWHEVYDYVRLHQPHPMFTAGNIDWQGQSDPHHLADKREVVDHLQRCFRVLAERTQLEPRLGHEYISHEDSGSGALPVTVHCRRVADGASITIRTRKLIKAFGYNVKPADPLPLTSKAVVSLSPDHCNLLGPEVTKAAGDIYVVGGGKTGMDTAHALVRNTRGTTVRMLIGAGTIFLDRELTTPRGLRRHWQGSTTLETFLDVAGRFDGHNELETMAYFRRKYGVAVDDQCRRFMFGVLSQRENDEIRSGVKEIIRDHLVDVIDGANGPELLLRSGTRRSIKPGSVVLNTTGYLGHSRALYEPYLSRTGNVLSIQPTSTTHFLSSQAAYFLTHLFLTGELASVPLYETDIAELRDASRDAFPAAAIALTLHNTSVIVNRLPRWVMKENGLDFLLLFPVHRRLLAFVKLMRFLKQRPGHLPKAMDTVRKRFGVRLGPIVSASA